jgi:hypothetical protein
MKDLFEDYEKMPEELADLPWNECESYKDLMEMLVKVEALGYTFDYYLDAVPFGLRKKGVALNELENYSND